LIALILTIVYQGTGYYENMYNTNNQFVGNLVMSIIVLIGSIAWLITFTVLMYKRGETPHEKK